jgi:hypothetical protein
MPPDLRYKYVGLWGSFESCGRFAIGLLSVGVQRLDQQKYAGADRPVTGLSSIYFMDNLPNTEKLAGLSKFWSESECN